MDRPKITPKEIQSILNIYSYGRDYIEDIKNNFLVNNPIISRWEKENTSYTIFDGTPKETSIIEWKNRKPEKYSCSCDQYKQRKKCDHLSASMLDMILNYQDYEESSKDLEDINTDRKLGLKKRRQKKLDRYEKINQSIEKIQVFLSGLSISGVSSINENTIESIKILIDETKKLRMSYLYSLLINLLSIVEDLYLRTLPQDNKNRARIAYNWRFLNNKISSEPLEKQYANYMMLINSFIKRYLKSAEDMNKIQILDFLGVITKTKTRETENLVFLFEDIERFGDSEKLIRNYYFSKNHSAFLYTENTYKQIQKDQLYQNRSRFVNATFNLHFKESKVGDTLQIKIGKQEDLDKDVLIDWNILYDIQDNSFESVIVLKPEDLDKYILFENELFQTSISNTKPKFIIGLKVDNNFKPKVAVFIEDNSIEYVNI